MSFQALRLHESGATPIREHALGLEHPKVAVCLSNLAELCQAQHKHEQAEGFYRRALSIWEKTLGPDHPQTAVCSERYTDLLQKLKQEDQAAV